MEENLQSAEEFRYSLEKRGKLLNRYGRWQRHILRHFKNVYY
jgi:hypothetical protein